MTTASPRRIVPAQLAFLAIYNPTLGPTDETFADQLVFYYSRSVNEARTASKKYGRNDTAGEDAARKEENEQLRQIGLAQGMVDFARSFSHGESVDSIETEKSRIVLHELEKGWWILASVDLTQLPSERLSEDAKGISAGDDTQSMVEYSSREVSPPALLVQQLVQAHCIFGLHHGPSLDDLFVRLSREKFCSTLDRYWTRYAKGWDVLLHANPAVDIFSGLKLASGGELGYGVGEEDWGSGEREVLEDLTRRTEGLEDILVSRFGETASAEEQKQWAEDEALPWLGSAAHPAAADGMVFSGTGALDRQSIRDVSLWMRHMYSYGEYAYGVRDNPLRERRKRRRRNPPERGRVSNGGTVGPQSKSPEEQNASQQHDHQDDVEVAHHEDTTGLPVDSRPESHPRVVSPESMTIPEDTQTSPVNGGPSIPPPIVSATERALEKATKRVDKAVPEAKIDPGGTADDSGTTLGIPDQYMKYLTFGLSTLGKSGPKRPTASRQSSASITVAPSQSQKREDNKAAAASRGDSGTDPAMTYVEPMPDGETLRTRISTQIRQENEGHFLIGLRGDLDAPTEDEEDVDLTDGSVQKKLDGSRIVLRTIQVKVTEKYGQDDDESLPTEHNMHASDLPGRRYRRVRVLIYVHRPFIYCFLFRDRTSSLQYTEFYRSLHQILSPIRKALLSSTDMTKVAQRIEESHVTSAVTSEDGKGSDLGRNTLPSRGTSSAPIFDLIYDPRLLTIHTSVPNIPIPGTLAAEGILTGQRGSASASPSSWTRLEALNVHSQILNTLQSVRSRKSDVERTSKTTRGWWVVWMKVPPSQPPDTPRSEPDMSSRATIDSAETLRSDRHYQISGEDMQVTAVAETEQDMHRLAFLVRKASEVPAAVKTNAAGSLAMSSLFGNMSLGGWRSTEDPTGGASAGWGPAALAGGIGVDARRYVEGLLSLNR